MDIHLSGKDVQLGLLHHSFNNSKTLSRSLAAGML